MPRRPALVVAPLTLLVLLTATLAGCAEPTRLPPPEPSAAAPLFASDEEALAAATAAYEEYLAVVDAALASPSEAPLLEVVASGEALSEVQESVAEFVDEGYVLEGLRVLGGATLQQVFVEDDETTVVAYFCEDLTRVALVDSNGSLLTTEDRPDFTVFEVTVQLRPETSTVDIRRFWDNVESC